MELVRLDLAALRKRKVSIELLDTLLECRSGPSENLLVECGIAVAVAYAH